MRWYLACRDDRVCHSRTSVQARLANRRGRRARPLVPDRSSIL
ncbi:MAG: hypothetical protein OZSIB_2697 [Candidatus Ozemobacter sibiricus]|uniref:Uncharacterized protein n=1 Tax=Candidatus Ozemobacter sibiricus TaxID=2268124 RepID=A0A367ZSX6_9BACT|nr:MAG: hypothetical protein OZSIB_2697 [Candidatus Ozemobacter sibiricus]